MNGLIIYCFKSLSSISYLLFFYFSNRCFLMFSDMFFFILFISLLIFSIISLLIVSVLSKSPFERYSLRTFVNSLGGVLEDTPVWLPTLVLPLFSFKFGLSSVWFFLGLVLGTFISYALISNRLAAYAHVLFKKSPDSQCSKDHDNMLISFFEKRYHDKTNTLRMIFSFFLLIFSAGIVSAGLVASTFIIKQLFSLPDQHVSILLLVFVFGAYILYACFEHFISRKKELSHEHFILTLNALCALLLPFFIFSLIMALFHFGNTDIIPFFKKDLATLFAARSDMFGTVEFSNPVLSGFTLMFSGLSWSIGFLGVPTFLTRTIHISVSRKDFETNVKTRSNGIKTTILSTFWIFILGLASLFTGLIVKYTEYKTADVFDSFDRVFFTESLISTLILFICALTFISIICFILRYISLTQSAFMSGILPSFRKPKNELVHLLFPVFFIAGCFVLVYAPKYSLIELTAYPWTGFGASFGAATLFSLYYKKTTKRGIVTGVVAGGIFGAVWRQLSVSGSEFFKIYEIVPAFILSCLIIWIVSYFESKERFYAPVEKDFCEMTKYLKSK